MVLRKLLKGLLSLLSSCVLAAGLLLPFAGNGQDLFFYQRLDSDLFMNPSNTFNDSSLTFDLRYQNEWPEIDDAFNILYLGVNRVHKKGWASSVQIVNDYQTENQSEFIGKFGFGKQFKIKRLEIDIATAFSLRRYQLTIDDKVLQMNEPDFGQVKTLISFSGGTSLKYKYSKENNNNHCKAGFFVLNSNEPGNAAIATASSKIRRVFGTSLSVNNEYQFRGEVFNTSLYSTFLNNKVASIFQIGWEQVLYYNDAKNELGFDLSWYSNRTIGLGVFYGYKKVKFNLAKGIETSYNPDYLSNPYYLLGLKFNL